MSSACYVDGIQFSDTTPTGTFGESGIVPWTAGTPCYSGCYDLPAGTLAARGVQNTQGGCTGAVRVRDVYQVVGPAGPAFSFQVSLLVQANLAPYTYVHAEIASGVQSAQCNTGPQCEPIFTISHAPGEPFEVSAELVVAGDAGVYPEAYGNATGVILFSGFPAGYSVVSCQNYDLPTPARPSSWGGVKALYR